MLEELHIEPERINPHDGAIALAPTGTSSRRTLDTRAAPKLLHGIPQAGTQLGDPTTPVRHVDLQHQRTNGSQSTLTGALRGSALHGGGLHPGRVRSIGRPLTAARAALDEERELGGALMLGVVAHA